MNANTRAVYVVRLRPETGMTEDAATCSLRAFLKAALRSYGLRCLSAEIEAVPDVSNISPNKANTDARGKPFELSRRRDSLVSVPEEIRDRGIEVAK